MKRYFQRYPPRIAELIEERAKRYMGGRTPLALAADISHWDRIIEWFPEAFDIADEGDAYDSGLVGRTDKGWPITARIIETWFWGDTSHGGKGNKRKTIPRATALDAITNFLIEKRYLLREELEDRPDIGIALAFQSLLSAPQLAHLGQTWASEYYSSVTTEDRVADISLRLTAALSDRCLTAELITRQVAPRADESPESSQHRLQRARPEKLTGWAYPVDSERLFVILTETPATDEFPTLWVLRRQERHFGVEWLNKHPLSHAIKYSIPIEVASAINLRNLTPDVSKLYYKSGGYRSDIVLSEITVTDSIINIHDGSIHIPDYLLLMCARDNDIDGAVYAIFRKADVNFVDPTNGMTPLHWAIKKGATDVFELLMADERLNPTILDHRGHLASRAALISLGYPELHVRVKELEDRYIAKHGASAVPPETPRPPQP